MKIMAYITAPSAEAKAETFARGFVDEFLPDLLKSQPEIVRCTANIVDAGLAGGLPGERMEAEHNDSGPNYEVVAEFWLQSAADHLGAIIAAITEASGSMDAYWVEEFVCKDTPEAKASTPAIRLITPCFPKPHLASPEVWSCWQEHVERANRIHVGMNRYIRNWHRSSLTADAPAYFGSALLSFPTVEDYQERFYKDKDGADEIAEDVARFVDSFVPLFTREVRVRT